VTIDETFRDWQLDPASERGRGFVEAVSSAVPGVDEQDLLRLGVDHCRHILGHGGVDGRFGTDVAALQERFADVADLDDEAAQTVLDAVLTWICPEFQ